MKLLLVTILAIITSIGGGIESFATQGSFVDTIQFIQYLDENTALEEVRKGNLDLYYFRVSSDRIENAESRDGLKVFESTGGSYSILVNPADSEKFNPFSIKDIRFALHYLVDRKLIVNELMGGYGTTMVSNYGEFDPDYLNLLNELESFHFRYNPIYANELISKSLTDVGAQKINDKWMINGDEIEIKFFIRSDDPVRKSIGEILSSELETLGFNVVKDYGDLNKAFVVVYGSNPSDQKWNLYTEGWGGRSAFVKYDSVGLAQMYSPWFSSMPGFNDPFYWNYKNDYLDSLTQKIYTGNFSSAQERNELIQQATTEGIEESVRIFLASKIDQYVVNEKVEGVINDFGAGVPSRFTPINARSDSDSLKIGVKQIYQGSWNPIMGLSDSYSTHIWNPIYDPGIFKHPYNGDNIPVRSHWVVETAGPDGKLDLPDDAIIWDPAVQQWKNVDENIQSTSKVTFDLTFSNWHHGKSMDMNDVLHSLYFTLEWGSEQQENDTTFDTEYTPRSTQVANTIIGVKQLDENNIEVYVDYWHFDESEIASWSDMWTSMPWEIVVAMEESVKDGKMSFSRSGAVSKNVNWLSLLIPNDSKIIQTYLQNFKDTEYIPNALQQLESNPDYFESRYNSSINWIEENNHAVISNGPFYLDAYSPESRTITIKAFNDEKYPFEAGQWKVFETTQFPKIINVEFPKAVEIGSELLIPITTRDSTVVHYFFTNSNGQIISTGSKNIDENNTIIELSEEESLNLIEGANDFKIFAVSDSVLRPDIFNTGFLAVHALDENYFENNIEVFEQINESNDNFGIFLFLIGIIIVGIIMYSRRKQKRSRLLP